LILIIGTGGGGSSAAFAAREAGYDGDITMVGTDPRPPYDRPYLSKEFIRGEVGEDKLWLHQLPEYAEQRIDLRTGVTVDGVDATSRRAELSDGSALHYMSLVIATGGTPRGLPELTGVANAFTLRSVDDSIALKQAIDSSRRLLVVGAGFIGAEVAASARVLGKDVVMVETARVPLERALGPEVGEVYARLHRTHGVDLRTGTRPISWQIEAGRATEAELSDGTTVAFDAVLVAIGIDANLDIPRALGFELQGGGVLVDAELRAAPGVWCAGDIATHAHPVFGRPVRAEHWEVAKGHGKACGKAAAGEDIGSYRTVPYFWSDQYDVNMEYVGSSGGGADLVWRGEPDSQRFSVFYLREGMIEAALCVNDSDTRRTARSLIAARVRPDPKALTDPGSDLKLLLPAETGG
jgi:3-phenylpropionate/trans-cinnamate dioxygenase ferredoxin reductase subunit